MPEDPRHRGGPLLRVHLVEDLFDGPFVMGLIDTDLDRIVLERRAHARNRRRVGGGEEQGLLLGRGGGDQGADLFLKTHVEHAVGFVQDQRLQGVEIEAPPAQMVEQAAGRADHHMGAMFQRAELGGEGDAAAEGQDLDVVGKAGQASQFLADLVGQFAGRAEHQRLHARGARLQVRQQADAEGGGLAAAGLGLGDHVLAGEDQRQGVGLNRRHFGIAE